MGARSSKCYFESTPLTESEKWMLYEAKLLKSTDQLCVAALNGERRRVALLLAKLPWIDVNKADVIENKALHLAARAGHLDVVALLLDHPGIDIKSKDCRGATALHLAAEAGHADVVALLLSQPGFAVNYWYPGPMLEPYANIADTRGMTAVDYAVLEGHTETVSILLEQPEIDVTGQLLLHNGVERSHAAVVELLLSCPEIDVNETDSCGETALHYAMRPFYAHPDPDILRKMLNNPDVDPNVRSSDGYTPIMDLLDSRLERNYNIDIKRYCLRAMVESNRVDLEVKHPLGLSLENLAR